MEKEAIAPELIFETSWEVCNKVGGIYTVLSTRARTLQKSHKDKIIFIGPDLTNGTKSKYFTESRVLLKDWKDNNNLPKEIKIRVGRWNIPGKPIAILVDFASMFAKNNEFYGEMWNEFGVDSLHAYGDYDEACAFSHAVGYVIESYYNYLNRQDIKVIAHFNEWTTGMGLLYIKAHVPSIATVFTTHATSIGRSICGNNKLLYDYLPGYNGDQMAQELNMEAKHSVEKTAAHNADAFTTVSDITAIECSQLLEKRPDVVTPNGFEQDFVPKAAEFKAKREEARAKLLNIASTLLGYKPKKDAILVSTSGRFEYKNKGIDVFIDALNSIRCNNSTKKELIAFIMVPAWVAGAREDLQNKLESKNTSDSGALSNPIITHNLHEYNSDKIINQLQFLGINNNSESLVKIIYVPSYLNGDDGIFNMSYYDLLIGMDITAFPSYYEPWGYTPLESIAFGVPTVTTDLSGFGQWIKLNFENDIDKTGVKVLHRTDSNYNDVVCHLANAISTYASANAKERATIKEAAMNTAQKAEWKNFIKFYYETYNIALANATKRNKNK